MSYGAFVILKTRQTCFTFTSSTPSSWIDFTLVIAKTWNNDLKGTFSVAGKPFKESFPIVNFPSEFINKS